MGVLPSAPSKCWESQCCGWEKLMKEFSLLKASCRTRLTEITRLEKEIKRTEESLPGITEFIDNV